MDAETESVSERLPWETLVAVLFGLKDQKIQRIIDAAGLTVDWSLRSNENYSAAIQRAWLPRVHQAYRSLSEDQQRSAAHAVAADLVVEGCEDALRPKLQRLGWDFAAGRLFRMGAAFRIDRDALTGLLSRGALDTDLLWAVERAAGVGRPLSVIMVDVDHFKVINDSHGHQAGDRVLASVAACIGAVADGKGTVYRYGGEELTIVLPNHTCQEAIAVAERARRELADARIDGLAVTASFGVSTFPDHGRTSGDLIAAADRALYDAKNKGRNLVRAFGEPEPDQTPRAPQRPLPPPGLDG